MAFIKVLPKEGHVEKTPDEMVTILKEHFSICEYDAEAGRDYVSSKLEALLRLPVDLPGKKESIDHLTQVQDQAIMVAFGDDETSVQSCCLIPGDAMFFGDAEAVAGTARKSVEKLADILDYELYEG